jgi:hypothetical protein
MLDCCIYELPSTKLGMVDQKFCLTGTVQLADRLSLYRSIALSLHLPQAHRHCMRHAAVRLLTT